jgi:hypothetical protein
MDFAIAPAGCGGVESWDVLCFSERDDNSVPARIATFGHRRHAEAFLTDLLHPAGTELAREPAGDDR